MAYTKKTWTKPQPVERTPFKPSYPASVEQEAIFDAIKNNSENLHLDAAPGSGKSTTIKWAMTLNKERNAAYLAFSKAIVTEIESQCPMDCTVATCHSFGYKALSQKFGRLFVFNDKVRNIIQDNYPKFNPSNFTGNEKGPAFARLKSTNDLIEKLRVNMADENDESEIDRISAQYNIDIDMMSDVKAMIPQIFKMIEETPQKIDFTDMIALPIRLGLKIPQFKMMYVDEAQDLNNLMMEYVFRMTGERVMTVSDKNQSIFGFSGADPKSTERLIEKFGSLELPLSTCYRCPKSIVALAATLYDKIKPFDKNPEGVVEYREDIDYEMKDGSMILSRRNASLIKPCFELLKKGRKAIIKGKDIGAGIIKLIEQLKASDIFNLVDKVEEYRNSRIEKLMSYKEMKANSVELINDQCDCIVEIASNCSSLSELKDRIGMIFDEKTVGITLSSIHRSKGLEAPHVTIWDYSRIRLSNDRMSESDHCQEKNLQYVALTRAMESLHLVK